MPSVTKVDNYKELGLNSETATVFNLKTMVKIPRFTLEKFPGARDELTTSMKSVGETMAIGRTFKEALQKGLRSLETGAVGFMGKAGSFRDALPSREELVPHLRIPNSQRLFAVRQALLAGFSVEELYDLTFIDPWFLRQRSEEHTSEL